MVVVDRSAAEHDWLRLGYGERLDWSTPPATDRARTDLAGARCLLVAGRVATLHTVVATLHRQRRLEETVLAYVPSADGADRAFAERLGVPKSPATLGHGEVRRVPLARDDLGGVLLDRATLSALDGTAPFGAQAYHDDTLIADGAILRIEVQTDLGRPDAGLIAKVRPTGIRRTTTTRGRAVQMACDDARLSTDGRVSTVHKRTFYVDDRAYWNVQVS